MPDSDSQALQAQVKGVLSFGSVLRVVVGALQQATRGNNNHTYVTTPQDTILVGCLYCKDTVWYINNDDDTDDDDNNNNPLVAIVVKASEVLKNTHLHTIHSQYTCGLV